MQGSAPSFNKSRVVRLVSLLPGVHLRELQRLLGISLNALRYHVESLSKSGEIMTGRDGGYLRLYPAGTSESDKIVYSMIRGSSARSIIRAITQEETGLSNKQICERTNLAKSTVSEYLAKFIDAKIVKVSFSPSDGNISYRLEDPNHLLRLMMNTGQRSLDAATDRFVELWDF